MVTEMKDRNRPRRGTASESQYSLFEFMRDFPDDAACLDWLWRTRYSPDGEHATCPRCGIVRTFRRYQTAQQRQSWTCTTCGLHLHPTAGTIFEKSSTSLHLWFYGIYLMTSTRCGISAKQLERELGVTYKTAWRMFHLIRSLLAEDVTALSGTVEADETWVGGKIRKFYPRAGGELARHRYESKTRVIGMVERGGRVRASVYPTGPLLTNVVEHVLPRTNVYTDEAKGYRRLPRYGYNHRRVHHASKVYVSGDVHTNTIEGFWSLMKRGINGVYHAVSARYLQSYLDEYTFRYNHRNDGRSMFRIVTERAASRG
jgi:transposase-like protein